MTVAPNVAIEDMSVEARIEKALQQPKNMQYRNHEQYSDVVARILKRDKHTKALFANIDREVLAEVIDSEMLYEYGFSTDALIAFLQEAFDFEGEVNFD